MAEGQRYNFPTAGQTWRGDAWFSWRPKGEFSVAWHSTNGCRESYGDEDARDRGGRKRAEEGQREEEREGTGSVATPNFNSLITGARATSCQGARIFQTIVFVNPSARAGRPYICARVIRTSTRTRVQTHLGFAFTTNPSAPCPRERIDLRRLSHSPVFSFFLSLAFLSRESP